MVLIEDMDGAQEVLYPLRELQSKRKISKTIPMKETLRNFYETLNTYVKASGKAMTARK